MSYTPIFVGERSFTHPLWRMLTGLARLESWSKIAEALQCQPGDWSTTRRSPAMTAWVTPFVACFFFRVHCTMRPGDLLSGGLMLGPNIRPHWSMGQILRSGSVGHNNTTSGGFFWQLPTAAALDQRVLQAIEIAPWW